MKRQYDILEPVDRGTDYGATVPYEWQPLRALRLQGFLLRVYCILIRSFLWRFLYQFFAEKSGIAQALQRTNVPDCPIHQAPADPRYGEADAALCHKITGKKPVTVPGGRDRTAAVLECFSSTARPESAPGPTVQEYHDAYKQGRTDPRTVTRFILNFLVKHNSPSEPSATAAQEAVTGAARQAAGRGACFLHWTYGAIGRNAMEAAEASAARWRAGKPLSVLDGVPFAVKDHMPASGFQGPAGTRFPKPDWDIDCPAVAALKALGAVAVCVTTMSELGMSPVGLNDVYGTPRNPWHLRHCCGGSSSGSAAVVASGLMPFALASDAGGSVRIPAAHCGVVGLMPSVRRVPRQTLVSTSSVVVTGVIAGIPADAALAYAVIARAGGTEAVADGDRPMSPLFGDVGPTPTPLRLPKFGGGGGTLSGVRIGVYRLWFDDCDPEVQALAQAGLDLMQAMGAQLVAIGIPDLHLCRVAHSVILGCDSLQDFRRRHSAQLRQSNRMIGRDLQVVYASLGEVTATEYVAAARIRGRMAAHMRALFKSVDFVVTPTVPEAAPRIADDPPTFDVTLISQTMKYMQLGNILGLAAVTVPCGVTSAGMPVGLHIFGPAWHEAAALAVAQVLQQTMPGIRDALHRRHVVVNPIEEKTHVADPDDQA
eukprot:jgi/Ulvmu1/9212/UM005_0312.1